MAALAGQHRRSPVPAHQGRGAKSGAGAQDRQRLSRGRGRRLADGMDVFRAHVGQAERQRLEVVHDGRLAEAAATQLSRGDGPG